ncbi:hypothetical protein P7C73_g2575, partial [Tremellales sp. Uapishka_1]
MAHLQDAITLSAGPSPPSVKPHEIANSPTQPSPTSPPALTTPLGAQRPSKHIHHRFKVSPFLLDPSRATVAARAGDESPEVEKVNDFCFDDWEGVVNHLLIVKSDLERYLRDPLYETFLVEDEPPKAEDKLPCTPYTPANKNPLEAYNPPAPEVLEQMLRKEVGKRATFKSKEKNWLGAFGFTLHTQSSDDEGGAML